MLGSFLAATVLLAFAPDLDFHVVIPSYEPTTGDLDVNFDINNPKQYDSTAIIRWDMPRPSDNQSPNDNSSNEPNNVQSGNDQDHDFGN